MKPINYVLLTAFVIASACHHGLKSTDVPAAVQQSLKQLHPSVQHAKWTKEDGGYEASFETDGKDCSLVFDETGHVTETEMAIPADQLPAAAKTYISTHYPGKKISEAATITRADGTIIYEAEINGKDLLFDTQGNSIK